MLAKPTKAINASSLLHKDQPLEPSEQPDNTRRKPISKFRLTDLPQELRRTILVFAMPDQAKNGASWEFDSWEVEETRGDPGFLSATTRIYNERLRLETILVTLQEGLINVDCRTQALDDWLTSVDFDLLRQAGMTSVQDGLSALRAVRVCPGIVNRSKSTGELLRRLPNLRELVIQKVDWFVIGRIGVNDRMVDGDALSKNLRSIDLDFPALELTSLEKLTLEIQKIPKRYHLCSTKQGSRRAIEWLGKEFEARGQRVVVDVALQAFDWVPGTRKSHACDQCDAER